MRQIYILDLTLVDVKRKTHVPQDGPSSTGKIVKNRPVSKSTMKKRKF